MDAQAMKLRESGKDHQVRDFLVYAAALTAEVVFGAVLHHELRDVRPWIFWPSYVLGCVWLLHYVHMLTEHLGFMPAHLKQILKSLREKKNDTAIEWRRLQGPFSAILHHSHDSAIFWERIQLWIQGLLVHKGNVPQQAPSLRDVGELLQLLMNADPTQAHWKGQSACISALVNATDAGSVDWVQLNGSISTLLDLQGRFPYLIIEHLGAHVQISERADSVLVWTDILFDDTRLSRKLSQDVESVLRTLHVPKQVEGIFSNSLKELAQKMAVLAEEKPIPKVDLATQYTYAGGVAQYYRDDQDDRFTVFATALDTPSRFWRDYETYFKNQAPLKNFNDAVFAEYASQELSNLTTPPDNVPIRRSEPPPAKSRVVLIKTAQLKAELATPDFWGFVEWHVQNHFGLKFLLSDKLRADWYERTLSQVTGQERAETIDDFIAYGDHCVFGRVNPNPDPEGKVTLGFLYNDAQLITKYSTFFQMLWRNDYSFTLSELWFVKQLGIDEAGPQEKWKQVAALYREVVARL